MHDLSRQGHLVGLREAKYTRGAQEVATSGGVQGGAGGVHHQTPLRVQISQVPKEVRDGGGDAAAPREAALVDPIWKEPI